MAMKFARVMSGSKEARVGGSSHPPSSWIKRAPIEVQEGW